MFCPNCGKAEQIPDTYCRSCGEYLADISDRFSLLRRALGVDTPGTQINVSLTINLVTAIVSVLLLIFLNGYFDALYTRTREPAPPVIYAVYLFLGLAAAWQLLSFVLNLGLKNIFGGGKGGVAPASPGADEHALPPATTHKSLPRADFENVVPASVVEDPTRIMDESPRK